MWLFWKKQYVQYVIIIPNLSNSFYTYCTSKIALARNISDKFPFLNRIELDYLSWLPGWKCRKKTEFQALLRKTIKESKSGWIADGEYSRSGKDILWSKAEIVIWLQYDFWFVYYRAWKRTLSRIIFKKECCNGNIETFWLLINNPEHRIPCGVWKYHWKHQHRIPKCDIPSNTPLKGHKNMDPFTTHQSSYMIL